MIGKERRQVEREQMQKKIFQRKKEGAQRI